MRILIAAGQLVLMDLRLFETTEHAAPDGGGVIVRHRHEHYHFEDTEEGPSDDDIRKLRGIDDD